MTDFIDIAVEGHVPPLRQPTSMACWATVATIMESWRRDSIITTEALLEEINEGFLSIFQSDTGLDNADVPDFLVAMGLTSEPPMSFGVQGFADLLANHGPLWITADEDLTDAFSIHARVLIGLHGDGTPAGTQASLIDPDRDSPIEESVSVLQEKFTQLAKGDNEHGGNLARVIHF